MPETYARALWKLVEGGLAPKKAVAALHGILKARSRDSMMPHIAKAFARLAERNRRRDGVVISIAREKDTSKAMREAKPVLGEIDASAGDVDVKIDDSLIGGWRLEGRDRVVDRSFKKKLLSMYNRATQ